MSTSLFETPSLPPTLDLINADVRTYVNAIEADNRHIAFFQAGVGIIEQAFCWKYPPYREKRVMVLAGIDRRELCRIILDKEMYFLSAQLSNLHYFFCSIPHERVSDPLTRGEWLSYCQAHWAQFTRETAQMQRGITTIRPVKG